MKISGFELLGSLKQSCSVSYAFIEHEGNLFFSCRLQSLAIGNYLCQNTRMHNWLHIWASQTSEILRFIFTLNSCQRL